MVRPAMQTEVWMSGKTDKGCISQKHRKAVFVKDQLPSMVSTINLGLQYFWEMS